MAARGCSGDLREGARGPISASSNVCIRPQADVREYPETTHSRRLSMSFLVLPRASRTMSDLMTILSLVLTINVPPYRLRIKSCRLAVSMYDQELSTCGNSC